MNSYLNVWLAALLMTYMNTIPAAAAAGAGAEKSAVHVKNEQAQKEKTDKQAESRLIRLFKAIKEDDIQAARRALKGTLDINGSQEWLMGPRAFVWATPLGAATLRGNFEMVKLLLEQPDIDIELGSSIGTPLIHAAIKAPKGEKYLKIARLLLSHGASPKNRGIDPKTKQPLEEGTFETIAISGDNPALQKIYDEWKMVRKNVLTIQTSVPADVQGIIMDY